MDFSLGAAFGSSEQLKEAIFLYEEANHVLLRIRDSHSLGKTVKNGGQSLAEPNSAIKYHDITYCCIHYGPRKTTISQKKIRSFRTDCPMKIRLVVSSDCTKLVVRETCLVHNHDVSREISDKLYRNGTLEQYELDEAAVLFASENLKPVPESANRYLTSAGVARQGLTPRVSTAIYGGNRKASQNSCPSPVANFKYLTPYDLENAIATRIPTTNTVQAGTLAKPSLSLIKKKPLESSGGRTGHDNIAIAARVSSLSSSASTELSGKEDISAFPVNHDLAADSPLLSQPEKIRRATQSATDLAVIVSYLPASRFSAALDCIERMKEIISSGEDLFFCKASLVTQVATVQTENVLKGDALWETCAEEPAPKKSVTRRSPLTTRKESVSKETASKDSIIKETTSSKGSVTRGSVTKPTAPKEAPPHRIILTSKTSALVTSPVATKSTAEAVHPGYRYRLPSANRSTSSSTPAASLSPVNCKSIPILIPSAQSASSSLISLASIRNAVISVGRPSERKSSENEGSETLSAETKGCKGNIPSSPRSVLKRCIANDRRVVIPAKLSKDDTGSSD